MAHNHKLNLVIFKPVQDDPIVDKMLQLFQFVKEDSSNTTINKEHVPLVLSRLTYELLAYYVDNPRNIDIKDAWQDYFLNIILTTPNLFSRLAQKIPYSAIGSSYLSGAGKELNMLQELFTFTWPKLIGRLTRLGLLDLNDISTCWQQVGKVEPSSSNDYYAERRVLKGIFSVSRNWSELLSDMADFHFNFGTGIMGQYWVFRADFSLPCPLIGVTDPDPIRLEQLKEYDHLRQQIVDNTAKFVRGAPANNILLYGDRGTGKSSTVKALVHQFGRQGLRLIEITKSQLSSLSNLTGLLKAFPNKFIIFIDDLSFEDNESQYKELKAVLEGSVEVKPANILIYATSNRRHLIREQFSDRQSSFDEVRVSDTIQEKLSLSDRFGITLVFPSPDQKEYLSIVSHLAQDRQLSIAKERLEQLALQWALWNNGRSGRTAKQFIDHLEGELLMGNKDIFNSL